MFPILVPQGNHRETVKNTAIGNGCSPMWWPHYNTWVCDCEDGLHCCDQQCSIITADSAKRTRDYDLTPV